MIKNTLFLLLFFVACTSDEESKRQLNSPYQGEWGGNFDGGNTGTIDFIVDKEGTINGILVFSSNNLSEEFQGYVAFDGKFYINSPNKYYFSGILNTSAPAKGKWKKLESSNSYISGNFTINKK
ncbi:hypothetical protein [Chryseobacterium nepalense]|uniref:Uncharacterized protein n=1 Tax=Chryseobacterium nepalense TaxID=1854498 RepID=A0ABY4K048_9FLAO|nr:hypothetical protein [Chryseobacterium nepalense]UPQ74177.1 hypothetical protein M0D58_08935 [Chryseobacterium nepalense]